MGKNTTGAMVRRAHKGKLFERKGRGFSTGELKKAGIQMDQARRMHLMVDPRRSTIYDFNVDILSKYAIELRAVVKKPVAAEPQEEEAEQLETVEAASE